MKPHFFVFCFALASSGVGQAALGWDGQSPDSGRKLDRLLNRTVDSPNRVTDGLMQLPANTPVRHYLENTGFEDGGVAGAEGVEIFRNNPVEIAFQPGANVRMADDITPACLDATNLTFLEVTVNGGGSGAGPGFSVEFQLFDGCPSHPTTPGQPIAGTFKSANLPNDGTFAVSLDLGNAPIAIPSRLWLAVKFSTNQAGWVLGDDPQVGESDGGLFDGPFPCGTTFGGCGVACANFAARMFGDSCETQSHFAYKSEILSGFFTGMAPVADVFADDVTPIGAPGNCTITSFRPGSSGAFGPYTMHVEVFSNDDTNDTPSAPVLGTFCAFTGPGGGVPFFNTCEVLPAAFVPTPDMWFVYSLPATSQSAGPLLTGDLAELGNSDDCFAIFGDPTENQWSPCVWFFGGCPINQTGNPCATFANSARCLGTEPVGACCDILTPGPENCVENVSSSLCGGLFAINSPCSAAQFDPECNQAACCKTDASCENLTADACRDQNGFWRPGRTCNETNLTCPPGVCLGAQADCLTPHDEVPGCNDLACCATVCDLDSFCCDVGWDQTCTDSAEQFCAFQFPANNDCINGTVITEGTFLINTIGSTLDGPTLPPGPHPLGCDEGDGVAVVGDVWFTYTAPATGTVTLDLCSDTDLDSRVVVYNSCTCPVEQADTVACADEGCPVISGPSKLEFPGVSGQCYKIRVGGAPGPNSVGRGTMTVSFSGTGPNCPSGAMNFTDPPAGAIDARQPNPVNSLTPRQGIQTLLASGPLGADSECFRLCETVTVPGSPNSITSVIDEASGVYTISLARPITPGAITRVAYSPTVGTPSIATFISHPANVNGDSLASPIDILRIIDCLNNVSPEVNCPWGTYSKDIDHSGQFNPADVLRVIDLLNGADVFDPWNNTGLPSGTCTP